MDSPKSVDRATTTTSPDDKATSTTSEEASVTRSSVRELREEIRKTLCELYALRHETESEVSKKFLACLNEHYKKKQKMEHMNAAVMIEKAFYFIRLHIKNNFVISNILAKELFKARKRFESTGGVLVGSEDCRRVMCINLPRQRKVNLLDSSVIQSSKEFLVMTPEEYNSVYSSVCDKFESGIEISPDVIKEIKARGEARTGWVPSQKLSNLLSEASPMKAPEGMQTRRSKKLLESKDDKLCKK